MDAMNAANPRVLAALISLALTPVGTLMLPSRAGAETVRELEACPGRVRITVIALAPAEAGRGARPDPAPVPAQDSGELSAGEGDSAAGGSIEAIGDFTSLAEIRRNGDALLQVDFQDRRSGRELRFPLRYSELRRFLLQHPLDYQDGDPGERMVRLIADLAASLRIEMKDPSGTEGKP